MKKHDLDMFKLVFIILALLWAAVSCQGCAAPKQGPQGAVGPAALPCTVTATAQGAEITCPDGSSDTINNGAQGLPGIQGLPGANGTDANPVTVVQFCTGYTSNYPSTFPETGVCVNNEIYAVYWDDSNAWFTEIPPGSYSSTSTSAPCNFTVAANCVIN